MKKIVPILLAGAALAAAVPAITAAQPYGYGRGRGDYDRYPTPRQITEREANIAQNIDQGERGGGLTRAEVARLRGQLRDIQRIEDADRRGGFSDAEVRDLNRRLDALANAVQRERRDGDQRGDPITDRLNNIEKSINDGVRGGGLTGAESARLRSDLENLRRLVAADRRSGDGLDARERADLNRRLDQLANDVQHQRRDGQTRGR